MTRTSLFALLALLLTTALAVPAFAADTSHDLIILNLDAPGAEEFVRTNQGKLDVAMVKPGHFAEIVVDAEALDLVRQSGFSYEMKTPNLEQFYAQRMAETSSQLGRSNFGIYHTYSENVAFQDSLRLLYPHVISEKWSIGQTHLGNEIWAFRVSANPDVDEDEPEILIDSMHHAREIMSSEFSIMFAEYLAQNYGTDPEITWLLDNRELYVIPIINPDGVLYNESTNPDGGGMWRKNRRNNGDGTYGVDPNRNYPYEWAYDNYGSSPYTDDLTYRGPYAGSEPEVQAFMNFVNSHNFITHDSIHTYSNLLLYAWGYADIPTPDNDLLAHMADEMVKYNGYEPGQPAGAINYTVNGGTIDWTYGAQDEHPVMYSFSSEIGGSGDGFWPSESRRGALFQENIWPHIYLMRVAGPFIAVHSPLAFGHSMGIQPGETGHIDFTIENQSVVASALDLSISVHTDDPWIQLGAAQFDLGTLASLETTTLGAGALPVTIDANCPDGHSASFTVTVHMADGDMVYELGFLVGNPTLVFADNLEDGTGNFQLEGTWAATTSQSHSPNNSLTDSPSGDYLDQTSYTATINGSFQAANLSFWHRYDIESGWDYGRVQLSADGGISWNTLESFTGTDNTWGQVSYDLSEYAGQELRFRFLMDTDYSVREDGWYIDDIEITGAGSDNLAPATPMVIAPTAGSTVGGSFDLIVFNVTDPEGAETVYGYRIYSDEDCTQLVQYTDDTPVNDSGETAWNISGLSAGNYWIRVYAGDGEQRSQLSEPMPITVNSISAVDDLVISGPTLRVLDRVSGGQARVQLGVPSNTRVAVDVYDMRGARVRQLYTGVMDAGVRVLTWDGRDDNGRSTASGVYFLRMKADGDIRTGRVVVVR